MQALPKGFRVEIEGVGSGEDTACKATVRDKAGKAIYEVEDNEIVLLHFGRLGGRNSPESVLFENFSGGVHCCWSYWFISLGSEPGLYAGLQNNYPIGVDQGAAGLWMNGADGEFDGFDELCHACSPKVEVFIELRGTRLINTSESHREAYDRDIADARKLLEPTHLARFRAVTDYEGQGRDEFYEEAKQVLNIALAYLYSGREAEAWKTLDEMWPPTDAPRIKKLILETKAKGLTSILHDPHKMK